MQVALHRVDFNGDPSPRREDDDQLFTFQVYLTVIDTDSMLGERPEMEQLAKLTTSIRYRFQDASPEAVAVPRACEWLVRVSGPLAILSEHLQMAKPFPVRASTDG